MTTAYVQCQQHKEIWGGGHASPFQDSPLLRRLQTVCVRLQVFVASALMEWHYDNSSAKVPNNIWEMGAKRFMAQPGFALAYIDFQLGLGDAANARATFERALTVTPPEEAQPLWDGYLKFEVQVL